MTESAALQAAADHAAALAVSRPVRFDWSEGPGDGVWDLTSGVTIRADDMEVVVGAVRARGGLEPALTLHGNDSHWSGVLRVTGDGSSVYGQRTAIDLVHLGEVFNARFDGFSLQNARRDCLSAESLAPNTIIAADLGTIFVHDCGSSAIVGHNSTVSMTWTSVTNYLPSTHPFQYAHFTTTGTHADLRAGDLVYVEDRSYLVTALGSHYVEVYPHYSGASSSGTLISAHGAGVRVTGGNTTGHHGRAYCQRVGVCLVDGGLYGGSWELGVEASGVGVQFGETTSGAHLRGWVVGHFELPSTRRSGIKVTRRGLEGLVIGGLLRDPVGSTRWEGWARWDDFAPATFLWNGAVPGASVQYTAP